MRQSTSALVAIGSKYEKGQESFICDFGFLALLSFYLHANGNR